jgi:hypothetical protein
MSQIKERQLDPRYKQTFGVYALKDNSGRTIPKIGFGAARIIEKNNETLRMMKMAQEEISLEDLVAQEATPPTPQKLLELITSAATGRNKQKTRYFIRFNTNSVVQPPSIEEVYGQPESVGFEDIQMGE